MAHRRFFRLTFGVSVFLWLAGVSGILLTLFPDIVHVPIVSLHYNIHFGIDAVGPWWRLFVPSLVALVLTCANVVYATWVWQREQVIAHACALTVLLVNVFVLLHIVFIILLNLSSTS